MNVHAENILSFKTLDFDFCSHRLCCVFGMGPTGGSNGAGKSNFFDILKLGLYGKNSKGLDKASVIRKHCKEGKIVVWWEHQSEERRLIRTFKPAESLTLMVNGVDLRIPSLAEAQKKVDEWLGHDYELFEATVMYAQEQTEFFVNADESSKKGLLEKILGFQRYTKAQNVAKQKEKALAQEVEAISTQLATLSGQTLAAKNSIAHLKERAAVEAEERQSKKKELTAQLQAIKLHNTKNLEAKVAELDSRILASNDLSTQAARLMSQIQEIQSDIRFNEQQYNARMTEKRTLEAKLAQALSLKDPRCPTCKRPYDPESLKQSQDNMRNDIAAKQKEADKYAADVEVLNTRKKDLYQRLAPLQEDLDKLDAVREQYQLACSSLEKLRIENEHRRSEYKLLKARIEALEQPTTTVEELERQKKILVDLEAKTKDKEAEQQQIASQLAHVRFWVNGFGNAGIKSLLLDTYAGFINQRINYYLSDITDGVIRAKFSTQKQLKSGELRDKIEFKVTIDNEEFDYKAYSGGQKTIINLSAMLALRDLAAQERTLIPIMIMDETFRELDDRFSTAVHSLLKRLSRTTSIYVVSHTEGLRDWIADYIVVSMNKERISSLLVDGAAKEKVSAAHEVADEN
jgi:DNA repair exonuclease SbcCD ATPase subunit